MKKTYRYRLAAERRTQLRSTSGFILFIEFLGKWKATGVGDKKAKIN